VRLALAGLVLVANLFSTVALAQDATTPATASTPRPTDPVVAGLWEIADDAERDAQESAERNRDQALNDYLRGIACKVAASACGDIRLYVMNRPYFNAMMAPNGYTEIWSGLLLRADNEAEAAFVIGHEISHFTQSHTQQMQEILRQRSNAAMVAGMVVGVIAAGAAANSPNAAGSISDVASGISNIVYLGTLASLYGFSRDMEEEADRLGYERARAAGYDPSAGGTLWRALIAETQASDSARVRRSTTRGSIFSTHPVSTERAAAIEARAAADGQSGELFRDRYREAIRPFLGQWLRDDLRRRDFGQTLHLIARLGANGEDLGVLNYFEGETYRLRRSEGDLAKAQAAYAIAITHPDAPPEAWRELGTALSRTGDRAAAADAYTTYLARAPDAEDRALIEQDIASLQTATPSGAAAQGRDAP
jgi:beta-barrel assembly-enhancing protease